MERSPTVVACGICCDSGTGEENAYKAAFDPAGKHMRELGGCGIFDSPEHLSTVVGAARGFSSFPARLPRCARILFSALDEALEKFSFAGISPERIGVYAGTSVGGILESENAFAKILESGREIADAAFRYYECSTLAELVAKRIGARGECSTFSTACSSSSLALESACLAISEGRADAAVVCGADTLSRITVNGFGSLRLLSGGVCKPFDSSRDGINLGEAGGVIVVVAREFLGSRPALAEFLSFGSTCDAYHPTAPHPDGAGAKAAVELCMDSSGLCAGEISYYCAHGTGTPANDSAETAVLRGVFGENSKIAFSSLKGVFGHTLGASGILNAIVAIRALSESAFPPSAGYSEGANPEPLKAALADARAKVALSVSLGFGGNNSCAAIAKPHSFAGAHASEKYSGKIFVYGAGTACPNPDFAKTPLACENAELLSDGLLSDIPPLKKRKWAKLQRMFLQAARAAAQYAGVSAFGGRTCVSCSTGLGMVEQTRKFLESVISSRERTPLPTAFTNSVHNAPASALALFFKATGYNCSTTAKEISFEAALAEACARIRGGSCDNAFVAGGDERDGIAELFAAQKSPAGAAVFSDSCAAYFIGRENPDFAAVAEIAKLEIRRAENCAESEIARVESVLADALGADEEVDAYFCPCRLSGAKSKMLEKISKHFGGFEFLEDYQGRNYSASAFAIAAALRRGAGTYAQYSLSSTSMAAITVFRVL